MKGMYSVYCLLIVIFCLSLFAQSGDHEPFTHTYSIVARDEQTGDIGSVTKWVIEKALDQIIIES